MRTTEDILPTLDMVSYEPEGLEEYQKVQAASLPVNRDADSGTVPNGPGGSL